MENNNIVIQTPPDIETDKEQKHDKEHEKEKEENAEKVVPLPHLHYDDHLTITSPRPPHVPPAHSKDHSIDGPSSPPSSSSQEPSARPSEQIFEMDKLDVTLPRSRSPSNPSSRPSSRPSSPSPPLSPSSPTSPSRAHSHTLEVPSLLSAKGLSSLLSRSRTPSPVGTPREDGKEEKENVEKREEKKEEQQEDNDRKVENGKENKEDVKSDPLSDSGITPKKKEEDKKEENGGKQEEKKEEERGELKTSANPTLQSSASGSGVQKKKRDDFEYGDLIGEGSFGEVRVAIDKATKIQYAAKILRKKQIVKEKKVKYVNTEKETMDLLRHPNIVRLYFTFQTPEELYYILELCPNGELLQLLKQAGTFSEEVARFYGAELLSAISYMHEKGIAHRDIKPENVLLGPAMHAKLSDFGTAKHIPLRGRSSSFVGTAEYVCPELLSQRSAGHPADMWSYGVMMFQMLTGNLPFKGVNEFQVFQEIGKNTFELPGHLSSVAKDFISKLLVSDPDARLDAATAKTHEFFAGVDWNHLDLTTPPVVEKRVAPTSPPSPARPPSPTHDEIIELPPAHQKATQKKSPKLLRILRSEKRSSTPSIVLPSSFPSSTSTSTPASPAPPSPPAMVRTVSMASGSSSSSSSSSSPPFSLNTSSDGKLHPPVNRSRQRASSGFEAPPKFLSQPTDHSRWATFLTENERILYSGMVQMRKKMFFSRQKLFIFITDKRLALLEPTTFKVQHEYSWEGSRVAATLKDTKSFTLTTGTKVRHFDEDSGNTRQLVDLVQYLSAKGTPV